MKVKYIKEHNNYPFGLGEVYHADFYKNGWYYIELDYVNRGLWRAECFEVVE